MDNIIQQFLLSIPYFKIEYIALLPAIALFLVGIFIETNYVGKVSFFLNSVTLISYFGIKQDIKPITGIITLAFFLLTTWSFLAYITKNNRTFKLSPFQQYENLIENYPNIRRFGGSAIVGLILLLNSKI